MEIGAPQAARLVSRGDVRRDQIRAAAIAQFTEHGIAKTSMAQIAAAAGVSRPALYQYYANKDEIFAEAFISMFEDLVDAALAALDAPGTPFEQLDGFLQRYEGDMWELMSASPHLDEITSAKTPTVAAAVHEVVERLWRGLAEHLKNIAPGRSGAHRVRRDGWLAMLRLSPAGFRSDQPSAEEYRARLTALARSVAADVAAAVG